MRINVMLIGVGPHAKRIYLPFIEMFKEQCDIALKVVVDTKDQEARVRKHLQDNGIVVEDQYYVHHARGAYAMSSTERSDLAHLIAKHRINAVIIASDPLSHVAYIQFAFTHGLHALIDKPVALEPYASVDERRAKKILTDYEALRSVYRAAERRYPHLIASCMSQRRYHSAMMRIREELGVVYRASGCPVTSIVCEHSDGQWRMPNELAHERYHGYTLGVGKCSHSGYHEFDVLHWFAEVAAGEKSYDRVTCYASFARPNDVLAQLTMRDYRTLFVETAGGSRRFRMADAELARRTKRYGEVDAHITFDFYKRSRKLTTMQLSLLHNGLSERHWLQAREDLYKGNGRIRHEYLSIYQGPLQAIKYESYIAPQAPSAIEGSGAVGGKLHADLLIFRNSKALNSNAATFEKIEYGVQRERGQIKYFREPQLEARAECFEEFLLAVSGKIPKNALRSALDAHFGSSLLMSLAYLSAAKAYNGRHPLATYAGGKIA